jgi:hypothetical protein
MHGQLKRQNQNQGRLFLTTSIQVGSLCPDPENAYFFHNIWVMDPSLYFDFISLYDFWMICSKIPSSTSLSRLIQRQYPVVCLPNLSSDLH